MASFFGHGLVAYTFTKLIDRQNLKLLLWLALFSTIMPDFDVVAFKFGIAYEHPLGHRGLTHSITFAVLWAALLAFLFGKTNKLIYFLVLFFSTVSHGFLDAMTNGGKGVGFFIPFDNERYFLPFTPIKVSPIGVKDFFSEWGLQIIWTEVKYIAIPCLVVLVFLYAFNSRK
ncbi:MAG: metal-dependent hydrolase [Flavobacteriaceae bacterium]|nr:metal-dependent hydrolase [Flavobacteriaceae bacterium]